MILCVDKQFKWSQQQTSNQFNSKIFIFSTTAVCCFFQRGLKKSSCCCLLCSSVTAAHIRPKQLVAFNSVVPLHCSPSALHCCVCCQFVIIYCCFSLFLTFCSVPLFQLIMFDTFFFSSQVLFTSFCLLCCWTCAVNVKQQIPNQLKHSIRGF